MCWSISQPTSPHLLCSSVLHLGKITYSCTLLQQKAISRARRVTVLEVFLTLHNNSIYDAATARNSYIRLLKFHKEYILYWNIYET